MAYIFMARRAGRAFGLYAYCRGHVWGFAKKNVCLLQPLHLFSSYLFIRQKRI